MFFYKLTPLLSRTEFIVFHGNHLSLILPFPSLTVLSPMCSKACSLCSPTPSSRLAPKAEWGLTLPILTAGNARLVLALVLVVFFFFFFWLCFVTESLPYLPVAVCHLHTCLLPETHSTCFSFLQILAHVGSSGILGCPSSPPHLLQPRPVLP